MRAFLRAYSDRDRIACYCLPMDQPEGLPTTVQYFSAQQSRARGAVIIWLMTVWRCAINLVCGHKRFTACRALGRVVVGRSAGSHVLICQPSGSVNEDHWPQPLGWRFLDIGRFIERTLGSFAAVELGA